MPFTIILYLGKCWDNNNISLHRGKNSVLPVMSRRNDVLNAFGDILNIKQGLRTTLICH